MYVHQLHETAEYCVQKLGVELYINRDNRIHFYHHKISHFHVTPFDLLAETAIFFMLRYIAARAISVVALFKEMASHLFPAKTPYCLKLVM